MHGRVLLSAALSLCLIAGCAKLAPPTTVKPPVPPALVPPAEPGPQARTVDWWLQQMTPEEKVGQLFWFGLEGPAVSPEAEQLINDGKAGGFIFFSRQGNDPDQLKALTDRLQALARGRTRPIPGLILSVDQEGGLVQRFGPPGFAAWPGNMAIGATGSEGHAEQVAGAMARELAAVGINLNISPDADVNVNPANPVIGIRSFGEDPQAVGRLVASAVRGAQAQGVSAGAKHFPGHGDTSVDSHKALPVVDHPWERLDRVELVPFRSAIAAGVDVIMAAHVLFPAVASDGLPASLSPKVLQDLLKNQLGFRGVVMTDAIDTMKAITDNYGVNRALVMAVQAGTDVLLVTESFGKQAALFDTVLQAVKDGRITAARLDDAVRRNLELKERRGLLAAARQMPPAPDLAANRQLAVQVGSEALTLVRNRDLPLRLPTDQPVLVVGPAYGSPGTALADGVKAQHPNVVSLTLDRSPTPDGVATVKAAAGQAGAIIYGVYDAGDYPAHQALIRALIGTGKPVIVVGMGEPYDLVDLPEVQTYVAAYGYQSSNLAGIGALAFGAAPPHGRLPVSIPGLYPIGHGLSY